MPAAEALVFDLYGTLLDPRSVEAACAGVTDNPAALAAHWRDVQLKQTWLLSLMGRWADFAEVTDEALRVAAASLGVALDEATRARLSAAWLDLQPYPEVALALGRLGPRRLAVLSNGSPAMLEGALGAAGLRERFEAVLSASEVRVYKPAPAVYALAERRLGLPRDAILFVSANAWDASGAAAFGLPAAWVNRRGEAGERPDPPPRFEVRDLAALADSL